MGGGRVDVDEDHSVISYLKPTRSIPQLQFTIPSHSGSKLRPPINTTQQSIILFAMVKQPQIATTILEPLKTHDEKENVGRLN